MLFHQIKNPVFIAGFYTAKHLFGFRVALSRSLQGSTLDVIEAYRHINVVKDQLAYVRKNAKTVFAHSVHEKIQKMAKKADVKITSCALVVYRHFIRFFQGCCDFGAKRHKPCIIITTTYNFIQYGILIFYFPDCTRLHVRVPKFSKFSGGACPQTPLESSA